MSTALGGVSYHYTNPDIIVLQIRRHIIKQIPYPGIKSWQVELAFHVAHSQNHQMAISWQPSVVLRATVITLFPLALTIYFLIIWRLYLVPQPDNANQLVFGRPSGNAIYYSWFVLASIGLTVFHFGREGVEDGMLSRPKWAAIGNPTHLRSHIRPDGWLRAFVRLLIPRSAAANAHGRTSFTWLLLGLVTLLGYVGLPLSGLTMEFETGYYLQNAAQVGADQRPMVTGFQKENWNARFVSDNRESAFTRWKRASIIPPPPGAGVIYTAQKGAARSELPDTFDKLPNTLPGNTGVSNLFLAPQPNGDNPIEGRSWGLTFSYQCSVVTKLSDFTILSQRNPDVGPGSTQAYGYDVLGSKATIEVYNQTMSGTKVYFANNLQAVAEVGYHWPYRQKKQSGSIQAPSECYNPIGIPGPDAKTMPYPGMDDEPQVLEIILWQNLTASGANANFVENPPNLDFTLTDTIPELQGAYQTFDEKKFASPFPMAAIGVRCTSNSAVGTAQLDGRRGKFSNFVRSDDTPEAASNMQCAERLSLGVPHLIFGAARGEREDEEWLSNFYGSIGKFKQGYSSKDFSSVGNSIPLQSTYLQAEELRRSLTRAYALYALQLVYNDGVGYVDSNGIYHEISEFVNEDAVSYTRDTVLVPGIVPSEVAVVFLALWAIGSFCFGVLYGFRR
ncbi:hypothetical protein V8F20_006141 [Naviculisporaceae sp. PSN 640]